LIKHAIFNLNNPIQLNQLNQPSNHHPYVILNTKSGTQNINAVF
jgi:hypothetical protein